MASTETTQNLDVITVRMARLDFKTPWGFSVKPPRVIDKVQGGGLADRAGLQTGDYIDEIQSQSNPTFLKVSELINKQANDLELVVLREPTVTRIWKPNVTDRNVNSTINRSLNNNVKVSLEHHKLQPDQPRGFNSGPRQFGAPTAPSPMTKSDHSQVRSEVLKMINENNQRPYSQPKGLLPNCFCCGRSIV
ncbi:unnamed protein product [Bursaphelenchus okinawaensis]|uniref:PDZ domain-containing protein n=1 Tax=Bursaphelenchus okinawaensis TaxID=465554 RepID=A0A811KTM0_9BILA|nr:unnamed protein product [Bursaphelenchus okinawaensis]CAG9110180.1 unnamed protein product [Bursaphelenchus okinawaensis]